ncbi:MAG: toll/interleukin-1 receptor domain-containing protein [Pseudomonadota bacterium]
MGVIFISHSSRNNDGAIRIRDWLSENGWGPSQIFLDLTEFATGDRWRQRLNQIGKDCDGVIVCLSDDWITSPECLREFNHAESAGKPIFPIIVKPVSITIPRFITDLQFTDVSSSQGAATGFERLKLALHRARIGPQHFPWPPTDEQDRLPYRGLEALTEKDAAVFFGRDAQITEGLDALRRMRDGSSKRVLVIAAASGAGKSSFLKAGLLARLQRDTDNFLVLPTMRPGRDALSGPEGLLVALGVEASPDTEEALDAHLKALQSQAARRITELTGRTADASQTPKPSIILPIDQGEEFFSADNVSGAKAIELIARCLGASEAFSVVLTIRSDSLGPLQGRNPLANQLELLNFPALQPSAFKEVIEGPASLAQPPIEIEPPLTTKLINDLNRSDALPLLAFTLERLVKEYGDDNLLELSE